MGLEWVIGIRHSLKGIVASIGNVCGIKIPRPKGESKSMKSIVE